MVSVIIPTFNEERVLPNTLHHLTRESGNFHVFVVDGWSTDHTLAMAKAFPLVTLLTAPKGRASQMNLGAKQAMQRNPVPTDWLLFLHADTVLPQGAIRRLNVLEPDTKLQAGGFHHQFSGVDWRLRVISWLDNFRCRISKVIYGDQALFIRQELFQQLGGFPDQSLLEDVALSEKILVHTTPTLLFPPVVTDSRKFHQMGIWRSLARVLTIILCVQFRLPFVPKAFFQDIR